jgi:hypothetical protein
MTRLRTGLRRRAAALALTAAAPAGRLLRGLPGLVAMLCAIAGVGLMFGAGAALLAAVPFLLALDNRAT